MERPNLDQIKTEVGEQYEDMEQALRDTNPGIYELLEIYNCYAPTPSTTDAYLRAPTPVNSQVSNSSSF